MWKTCESVNNSKRRKNGRFVSIKKSMKLTKHVAAMVAAKKIKRCVQNVVQNKHDVCEERPAAGLIGEGNRIVDLIELRKNLKCYMCNTVLSLQNMKRESRTGLHSVLTIKCENCHIMSKVKTGKINENKISQTNLSVIHGAIHSGVGNTALNKILACANIPTISDELYKLCEKLVGKAIEEEATNSCKRAALEERKLVIENVQEMCEQLSPDVVEDLYPHLTSLKSSLKSSVHENIYI